MRIIPVLDIKSGRAVAARAGDRANYRPVRSILHEGSDPIAIALAYRDVLGLRDVYLADLDAIAGAGPALPLYRAIDDAGMALWVDAGVREVDDAGPLIAAGASAVVAGLETLRGPDVLGDLVSRFGPERVIFSLDLRDGKPLVPTLTSWGTDDPRQIAATALAIGVRRLILLDLARVGTGQGVGTDALLRSIRADYPEVEITVGGGISTHEDIENSGISGASAVLVGSALHDGRIGRGDGRSG
ncbi:MAG: hisA/hisF family protein [Planctomycetota bacterium]|nr:hisA/hisF family protein [Planctomycetota bacterium]